MQLDNKMRIKHLTQMMGIIILSIPINSWLEDFARSGIGGAFISLIGFCLVIFGIFDL